MRSDLSAHSDKPILRAIRGEPVEHPPFWLMRQAGRYLPEYRAVRADARDFIQLCLTPDLATEITLQPIRRYGMDAAILFSDILMVPLALGQKVWFEEGEGPRLEPIADRAGLARLGASLDLGRMEPVYQTIRQVAAALPVRTTLIGFAGAPWTLATYVVEGRSSRAFTKVKSWAMSDPEGFGELIDRLTQGVITHLSAQIEAGAEIVQIFDSWAIAALDVDFERWIVAPTQKIVAALKARWPDVPIIGFPKSIGQAYARYAAATGVDAVSLDNEVKLDFAASLQQTIAVQGNLDPLLLVEGGEALDAAIAKILAALRHGRFIFNLGHGVLQTTPPAHVERLCRLVRGG